MGCSAWLRFVQRLLLLLLLCLLLLLLLLLPLLLLLLLLLPAVPASALPPQLVLASGGALALCARCAHFQAEFPPEVPQTHTFQMPPPPPPKKATPASIGL